MTSSVLNAHVPRQFTRRYEYARQLHTKSFREQIGRRNLTWLNKKKKAEGFFVGVFSPQGINLAVNQPEHLHPLYSPLLFFYCPLPICSLPKTNTVLGSQEGGIGCFKRENFVTENSEPLQNTEGRWGWEDKTTGNT